MAEVIRTYSPEEAAARRKAFIEEHVAPVAAKFLAKWPQLQSAVLMVGQYWADEAIDAVHGSLIFSLSPSPDMAAYPAKSPAPQKRGWSLFGRKPAEDDVDFSFDTFVEGPETTKALGGVWTDNRLWEERNDTWIDQWDSNGEQISLFAAYCKEGTHQEMTFPESHAPCCFFVRGSGPSGLDIRMVEKQLRPWLDGVAPQDFEE